MYSIPNEFNDLPPMSGAPPQYAPTMSSQQFDPLWSNNHQMMQSDGQYGSQGNFSQTQYGDYLTQAPMNQQNNLPNAVMPTPSSFNYPVPQIPQMAPQLPVSQPVAENNEPPSREITVKLEKPEIWNEFHKLGNEMLVLPAGRLIFPRLNYTIDGLNPNCQYSVGLKLRRVNKYYMEFNKKKTPTEWKESAKLVQEVPEESNEVFVDSRIGSHFMENGIDCSMVNINSIGRKTAEEGTDQMKEVEGEESKKKVYRKRVPTKEKKMLVHSLCRYLPVLRIYSVDTRSSSVELLKEFSFEETQFVVTTIIKNDAVTRLKTKHNKYARGDYKVSVSKTSDAKPATPPTLDTTTDSSGYSSMDSTIASTSSISPTPRGQKRSFSSVEELSETGMKRQKESRLEEYEVPISHCPSTQEPENLQNYNRYDSSTYGSSEELSSAPPYKPAKKTPALNDVTNCHVNDNRGSVIPPQQYPGLPSTSQMHTFPDYSAASSEQYGHFPQYSANSTSSNNVQNHYSYAQPSYQQPWKPSSSQPHPYQYGQPTQFSSMAPTPFDQTAHSSTATPSSQQQTPYSYNQWNSGNLDFGMNSNYRF
ncbi:hypothetical protein GCK72_002685 [Caenorhabditis remanei]|uniref:T-box domain-containing protein n=1 Tax=Caenorhabditis remanei TaxID=31234 RepID=A0A6A5HUM4_CAERE|nr:hypothetical protein GCK72_002685 [Caenorhabditis remanei]KAF1770861.1 hypothetical protein GCK72_002685 [Caenorhabditis remanei]